MKIVNQNIQIDGIDKKILRALMEDARIPILEIARSVGISGAAIFTWGKIQCCRRSDP